MRFRVIFKQKNQDFSKEYAEQYNFGKESNNNLKYLFDSTYGITVDVNEYSISENSNYKLQGTLDNGSLIDETISNMKILKCFDCENKHVSTFAVSVDLIDKTHKVYDKKHNITRYYFYLKPDKDFVELQRGVFVDIDSIPKVFIKK